MSISKKYKEQTGAIADYGSFKELVTKSNLFVDKTSFIQQVIDNSQKSILITYPNGWGKTLNLDMLKTFFELESGDCKQDKPVIVDNSWLWNFFWFWKKSDPEIIDKNVICNKDIFESLSITNVDSGYYMRYQGAYPVIYISLKGVVGSSFVEVEEKLKDLIKSLYNEHLYLAHSDKLQDDQKLDFEKYVNKDYPYNSYSFAIKESLIFLSKLLSKHHGKKVYVLVDDYDAPVKFLFLNYVGHKISFKDKLINEVGSLISSTVCATVQNNEYTEKVILTGIFDPTVIEYDIGCDGIMTYSISDEYFSKNFGFSDEEINKLVAQFPFINSAKMINFIKNLYGGYVVPANSQEHKIIPLATINHLRYKQDPEFSNPIAYGDTDYLLQALLSQETNKNNNFSEKLFEIVQQGSVQMDFKNYVSLFDYDWLSEIDNELFFSYLLLNAGLLTVQKINSEYKFSIPNQSSLLKFLDALKESKYQDIAYKLQKSEQLTIVKMIEKKDEIGVIEELQESNVVCEENAMNFNFFHLVAIFGLKNVFTELLKSECAGNLYFANDKIEHLKPVDYAFIFKNYNVLYRMKEYYQNNNQELINVLELKNTIFCYILAKNLITTTSLATHGISNNIVNNNGERSYTTKLIADIFKQAINSFDEHIIARQCTQHSDYQEIDISHPNQFSSLKQFEKYLLHNDNAQVMLNQDCSDRQKKLSELTHPIFSNSFHSNMELKFTLCDEHMKDEL